MTGPLRAPLQAVNEVWFERPDRLPLEVEVLRLEKLLRRRLGIDLGEPQRIHFHQAALVEAGASTHEVDFRAWPVRPGALIVVKAGQVQAFTARRVLRGTLALFTPAFLQGRSHAEPALAEAARALLAAGPVVPLGGRSRQEALMAFRLLRSRASAPPARFGEGAVGAALSLFVFLLAGLPEVEAASRASTSEDPLVQRFLRLVEAEFTRNRAVAFYARALGVSIRSLDRRLLAARSVTARGAISARTLLEAKRMLTIPGVSVKAVAGELGFDEPQNFTRFFRTLAGCSPTSFREAIAGSRRSPDLSS